VRRELPNHSVNLHPAKAQIFVPPGMAPRESFDIRVVASAEAPGRLTSYFSQFFHRQHFNGIRYLSKSGHHIEHWALFEPASLSARLCETIPRQPGSHRSHAHLQPGRGLALRKTGCHARFSIGTLTPPRSRNSQPMLSVYPQHSASRASISAQFQQYRRFRSQPWSTGRNPCIEPPPSPSI
jgi:hypothetical protein